MKRLLSFLLCACLLLTVTACSGGGGANSEPAEGRSADRADKRDRTDEQYPKPSRRGRLQRFDLQLIPA